jgi:6-phosphogluconolactonase (cycloisomerase 2 family)
VRTHAVLSTALLASLAACSPDSGTTAPAASQGTELSVVSESARRGNDHGGAVYVLSNNATSNAILVYPRRNDGHLGAPSSIPTGGRGTGGGLGNQYGLVLDDEGEMLFGVNAGSDEISAFRVTDASLQQTDRVASGGNQPVSIAVANHLVYVLNDGATANITGYFLTERGKLVPIAGSTRQRSAPAGAIDGAEIKFSPDGRSLVVTEKAANLVVTYPVLPNGRTGDPKLQPSSGPTPFGFDFTRNGTLVVAEAAGGAAGASTVSSYNIDRRANLSLVTGSVHNGASAVCWIVVSADGSTAYAANTGSGTISTFSIGRSGSLALTAATAGATGTGSSPGDMALSRGDRFLYVRSGATNSIVIFATGANGELTPVDTQAGLPNGTNGLAAR